MRTARLVESQATVVRLSALEAAALNEAGRRLASNTTYRGPAESSIDRTIVLCEPVDTEQWRVTVRNAIGVIAIEPDFQLIVEPKIPIEHFLYLAEQAGTIPERYAQRTIAAEAASLWDILAHWFVSATKDVLRHDLLRDYEEVEDQTPAVRGSLRLLDSTALFYAGCTEFVCTFDEYGLDTPLNRVLRAAATAIQANPFLRPDLRRDARRLTLRMNDVGDLRPGDVQTPWERRSRYYSDAIQLARHILAHQGRTLNSGQHPVWTFLFRTPPVIEEGLRKVAQSAGVGTVDNENLPLPGSLQTLNPDLVFRDGAVPIATADVKYKLCTGDWKRPDLYQAVAFATGYRVPHAAILDFITTDASVLAPVAIGDVTLSHLPWFATPSVAPAQAHEAFVASLRRWSQSVAKPTAA